MDSPEELRQTVGEALTTKLGEMIGTEGPIDPFDSREIEPILDAVMPPVDKALTSMARMFHNACADLGDIHDALGLDPAEAGGAVPILTAIAELKAQVQVETTGGYLFVAMDDDKVAHLTHCDDREAIVAATIAAMWFPAAEIDADGREQVEAIVDDLIDGGVHTFEGDAPLYLFKLPEARETQKDSAGWLLDGSLLYRLTDEARPVNRDEISITMADGSRTTEARAKRASEILAMLSGAPKAQCAARKQGSVGGNPPAECDWPACGCDDAANRVIEALAESGQLVTTVGQRDVLTERERQCSGEGFTPMQDDRYQDGSLAAAAACYALHSGGYRMGSAGHAPAWWPKTWGAAWWKPTTDRRNLVKAAALIVAEIERIDRAAAKVKA